MEVKEGVLHYAILEDLKLVVDNWKGHLNIERVISFKLQQSQNKI